jgi:hypothetical protein
MPSWLRLLIDPQTPGAQRHDQISTDEIERRYGVSLDFELRLGGIIGVAEIVDCIRPHPSQWYAPEHYAFVLANSRPLPFVRWNGALSLCNAPYDLLSMLNLGSSEARTASVMIPNH